MYKDVSFHTSLSHDVPVDVSGVVTSTSVPLAASTAEQRRILRLHRLVPAARLLCVRETNQKNRTE